MLKVCVEVHCVVFINCTHLFCVFACYIRWTKVGSVGGYQCERLELDSVIMLWFMLKNGVTNYNLFF